MMECRRCGKGDVMSLLVLLTNQNLLVVFRSALLDIARTVRIYEAIGVLSLSNSSFLSSFSL